MSSVEHVNLGIALWLDADGDLAVAPDGDLAITPNGRVTLLQDVRDLLDTLPGDLFGHPTYGAGVARLFGEEDRPDFESLVIRAITDALMLAGIGASTPLTNFNVGSVIRTLTEGVAEVVGELYAFASDMLKQGFLDTATGVWLDRKAAEYGVTRNPAIVTEGTVIFSRAEPRTTNVPIPAGSIVATPRDQSGREYRYLTMAQARRRTTRSRSRILAGTPPRQTCSSLNSYGFLAVDGVPAFPSRKGSDRFSLIGRAR